ncbi:MAG: AsmA family protein [Magnetococcales bacterium]|nr:AsmA family protein [Magnetococcales bacterium]
MEGRYKGDVEGQREGLALKLPGMDLTVKAEGGNLPSGGADLHLSGHGEVDLTRQTARITQAKLEGMEQLKAEGSITVTRFSPYALSGELNLEPVNPRALLTKLGQKAPATGDEKALTALKLKTAFAVDPEKLELSRMEAKLDDTTLRGGITWPLGAGSTVRLELDGDTLDLNRYLAAKGGASAAPAPSTPQGGDAAPKAVPSAPPAATATAGDDLPVATLKRLDLDGKIRLGALKLGTGRFQEVQLTLKGKDGVLRLEPATMKLYGGSTRLDATLDARGETPKLTMKQNLQGVQLEPMLKEMTQDASVAGAANLDLDVTSTGKSVAALKQGLEGRVSFNIKDGAYLKKDLTHAIREAYGAYAATKGKTIQVGEDTGRTPFTTLEGTAEIHRGVLETNNFQAVSPALKVTGAGKVDLVQSQMDFTTKTNVAAALSDVDSRSVNDLKGMSIPVRIHGDLSHPRTTVDLAGLLEEALKTKAMEKVQEKVQEKLGGKLQEKLGGKLGEKLGIKSPEPAAPGSPTTAPQGGTTAPQGGTTAPQGGTTAPQGGTTAPAPAGGKTAAPKVEDLLKKALPLGR